MRVCVPAGLRPPAPSLDVVLRVRGFVQHGHVHIAAEVAVALLLTPHVALGTPTQALEPEETPLDEQHDGELLLTPQVAPATSTSRVQSHTSEMIGPGNQGSMEGTCESLRGRGRGRERMERGGRERENREPWRGREEREGERAGGRGRERREREGREREREREKRENEMCACACVCARLRGESGEDSAFATRLTFSVAH